LLLLLLLLLLQTKKKKHKIKKKMDRSDEDNDIGIIEYITESDTEDETDIAKGVGEEEIILEDYVLLENIMNSSQKKKKDKRGAEDILKNSNIAPKEYLDEITGEISEKYLRNSKNTLMCKKIILNREKRRRELLENCAELDQFIVESFVHVMEGYEIAYKWIRDLRNKNKVIEYVTSEDNTIRVFHKETTERDLPHFRFHCRYVKMYMGKRKKKQIEEDSIVRVEGALTQNERDIREMSKPWYEHPNSLISDDRISVLEMLNCVFIEPYLTLLESIKM
jgi:hypothetical protein